MERTRLERYSVRIALAAGIVVTIALWVYTGYSFTTTINTVRDDAADVTSRYTQGQQLLVTVTTQVLLSSVRVRDALLSTAPAAIPAYREDVEESYRVIRMAIEDYEPVMRSPIDAAQILGLRAELDRFHQAAVVVLDEAEHARPETGEALTRNLLTAREAALLKSEEIQGLNRQAYSAQQRDVANIYQSAARRSRAQLGVSLVLSLAVLLLTSVSTAKLDSRRRMRLTPDTALQQPIYDVGELLTGIRSQLSLARAAAMAGGDCVLPIVEAQALTATAEQTVRNLSSWPTP